MEPEVLGPTVHNGSLPFHDPSANTWMFILDAVELTLIMCSFPLITSIFFTFYRSPLFHRNLVCLFTNMFLEFLVLSTARIAVLVGGFLLESDVLPAGIAESAAVHIAGPVMSAQIVRLAACAAFLFTVPSFMLERALATIYFRVYEHSRMIKTMVAFNVCQWVLGCSVTYLFLSDIIHEPVMIAGLCILMLFCFLGYVFCTVSNNKLYYDLQTNAQSFTLSERFQLSENLKSRLLLGKLFLLNVCGNIICLVVFVLISQTKGDLLVEAIRLSFNYIVVIYSYVLPIISLTTFKSLRLSYVDCFARWRRKVFPSTLRNLSFDAPADDVRRQLKHLKTSKGDQMVFSVDQEQRIYFQKLESIWAYQSRKKPWYSSHSNSYKKYTVKDLPQTC